MAGMEMVWRGIIAGVMMLPVAVCAAGLEPAGRFVWQSAQAEFGGLSGLEMSPDGDRFLAVSDRGFIFEGHPVRTATGQITAVDPVKRHDLLERDGTVMKRFLRDAEGLAVMPSGQIYVSFESYPRIWRYDRAGGPAHATHLWDHFWDIRDNAGLEALTPTPEGGLLAIAETVTDGFAATYSYDGDRWTPSAALAVPDGFRISGADLGPDGKLYLLERKLDWLSGFVSRIRRLDRGETGTGEVLLTSAAGDLGNTEGISLWQDAGGRIMITLISDDNFSPLQSTILAEFRVVE